MFVNEIAAYILLCEHSSNDFEDAGPTTEEMLERGQRLIDAMTYVFEHLDSAEVTDEGLQKVFYDAGNEFYGKPRLREFFKDIYWVLTGKPDGARIGKLVNIWGVDEFRTRMSQRLHSPLSPF